MAAKKRETTQALSDRKVFDLAAQLDSSKERAKKYEDDPKVGWRPIQKRLVAELKRRRVKSLVDSSLVKVTLVAPEKVVYDEDGLWSALKPAKRKLVFDRTINLGALPRDVQAEIVKTLTPSQRKDVIKHKLNVDKLSEAVQGDKVDIDIVSEHSEIQEMAPYIIVSQGESQ